MNTKLLTSLGCLLLLAATMTPAVLGHDDRNDDPNVSTGTTNADGVSGRYVDSAGPAISNSGPAIIIPDPTDPTTPLLTIPSGLLFVGGLMTCDAEVAGPGLVPVPADEENVDGAPSPAGPLGPGTLPDATTGNVGGFDDGGHGGACHVGTYDVPSYNTVGCPGEFAYANDDVSGDVFIGASCDWEGQGGEDFDAGFLVCLANVPNTNPVDCLTQLVDIVLNIVNCALGQPTCGGGIGGDVCGGDGSADGSNYGSGNAGVAYPAGAAGSSQFGEAYGNGVADDDGDNCGSNFATASVFVFDQVDIGTAGASLAIVGDIWQE
jgi:hypothetical protein